MKIHEINLANNTMIIEIPSDLLTILADYQAHNCEIAVAQIDVKTDKKDNSIVSIEAKKSRNKKQDKQDKKETLVKADKRNTAVEEVTHLDILNLIKLFIRKGEPGSKDRTDTVRTLLAKKYDVMAVKDIQDKDLLTARDDLLDLIEKGELNLSDEF